MGIPKDVIIALGVVLALSVLLAWAGVWAGRRLGKTGASILAILAAGVLVLHALWLGDNLLLARVLPVPNVLFWSNVQTPAVGLLAGLAWVRLRGPKWQRLVLVVPLALVGVWRAYAPLSGALPPIGPSRWSDGVCRQASTSSCSAAAAATVLAARGIQADEREMIDLCLTREAGTALLGVYRGLKLKAAAANLDVRVFGGSLEDLRRQPVPAVVTIGLPGLDEGFFTMGSRHSVALLAFRDDGTVEVADPFAGRQRWKLEQFRAAWKGEAIMLVPRQ